LLNNVVKAPLHLILGQWCEAEACATWLHSGDDLADVIANEAEADVLRVLLNDCNSTITMRRRKATTYVCAVHDWFTNTIYIGCSASFMTDTSSQSRLRRASHGVRLVQNDKLESRAVGKTHTHVNTTFRSNIGFRYSTCHDNI
jgi:hypothetical protein